MWEARVKWCVGVTMLLVVASGCAGAGASRPSAESTGVHASGVSAPLEPDSIPVGSAAAAPTAVPTTVPSTVVTGAQPTVPVAASEAVSPSVPTVTVVTLADGVITQSDDHECSNISAQSLALGELEFRRTGPTDTELVVHYGAAGVDADHEPLPGQVTIPAGAASAETSVHPSMSFGSAPFHVHRSSSLTVSLEDGPAYDLGATSSAVITLRFDVDVFGCDTASG